MTSKNNLAEAIKQAGTAQTESKLTESDMAKWMKEGEIAVRAFIKGIQGEGKSRVEVLVQVANVPTRLQAEAYVKGWKEAATKNASDKGKAGEELYDASKNAEVFASTMGRVVRSVFGVRRLNDAKKMETVYAKGFDSGKDAQAAGREATLEILTGKGSINYKIGALATKKERDTQPLDAVQRRIALGAEVKPDAADFAKAVGITGAKDDATRDRASLGVMLSGIKLAPLTALRSIILTTCESARRSQSEAYSEWGIEARKLLDKMEAAESSKPTADKLREPELQG